MKIFYLILFLVSNLTTFAQEIIINYNTNTNKINNIYLFGESGIFNINKNGELESVIIGNYTNKDNVFNMIDYFENRRIAPKFILTNTKIFLNQFKEVNYPTSYYIDERFKNLPISINNIKITYFDNYSDNDIVKGKIKSIGNYKISYYDDYYLSDDIKGKIKSISNINFKYINKYYNEEINGYFSEIGNIKIKYYTQNLKEYLNNKTKSIGYYTLKYFDSYLDDTNNGKFKQITSNGSVSDFTLVTDY